MAHGRQELRQYPFQHVAEINSANVKALKLAWTFSTGLTHGHEAAPLVVNNTMYVVTPWPNTLFALDLTKPGAPVKWRYEPHPSAASQGEACCDVVNRGAAYYHGKIFFNTLDVHTVAVDAATGKEVWKTRLGDINMGESMTMAPLVAKGKVIVGNSGGEFGVRGWLAGLDAETGKLAWRAYGTGPDKDVLIGPNFHPFYAQDRGKDLGVHSWPGEMWKIGGVAAWSWISFDPDLDLIYYGTSNAGPWNADQRPGDNKWGSTLFARRPETGEAIWAYQLNPHDDHDYDGVNENILLDLTINGRRVKCLRIRIATRACTYGSRHGRGNFRRNLCVSEHQRRRGSEDRQAELNPAKSTGFKTVRDICPAPPGGKDWPPKLFRRERACSISRTTISAWRCKACKPTIFRAPLM